MEMLLHEMKDALSITGLDVDHVWSCESEPCNRDFLEQIVDVKVIGLDSLSLAAMLVSMPLCSRRS